MSKIQELMIGEHPNDDSVFSNWLICNDTECTEGKIHRSLVEDIEYREQAIDEISNFLINHHLSNRNRSLLERKRSILKKYDFKEYAEKLNIIPNADKTKKGNLGEVILSEYLQKTTGIDILIYKLRYNSNLDQAMKGDDVLLVNEEKILIGESKYRSNSDKGVLSEISKNFGNSLTLPISLSFIADRLYEEGKLELSDMITEIEYNLPKRNIKIKYVGFIISTSSAHRVVEKHMSSSNKDFIMVTLNIDNPKNFLEEAFKGAKMKIEGAVCSEYRKYPEKV